MLAERMRANIESLKLKHGGSPVADIVTISIGIVCMQLDKQMSAADIIKKADDALYRAKEIGRNRVECSG